MNYCENLVAAYLRLNGFLLLPQFTVFSGQQHNHVDIIGLRAARSSEVVEGHSLKIDPVLFGHLTDALGSDAYATLVAVAAEVRSNHNREFPLPAHVDYLRNFFGGVRVIPLAFSTHHDGMIRIDRTVSIGLHHAKKWIDERIDSMSGQRLTKDGSWNWSEPFLADLLAERRLEY